MSNQPGIWLPPIGLSVAYPCVHEGLSVACQSHAHTRAVSDCSTCPALLTGALASMDAHMHADMLHNNQHSTIANPPFQPTSPFTPLICMHAHMYACNWSTHMARMLA